MGHRVGVELDAVAVRAVEVRRGAVRAWAEVPLPPGAVARGEVQDADAVASALRQLWKEGRFGTRRCVLGVANQLAVVRPVSLPPLGPDDLRAALRYELDDLVPFPIAETVADALVLPGVRPEPPHGEHDVAMLAVAVHEPAVQVLLGAARRARLRVDAVDMVPFALVRSARYVSARDVAATTTVQPLPEGVPALAGGFVPPPEAGAGPVTAASPVSVHGDDQAGEALVHVAGDVISMVVHCGGTPRFARLVVDRSASNAHMTAEIEATLAIIEQLRQREPGAPAAPVNRHPVAEAIRSSLDYFASQSGAVPIRSIRLSGVSARVSQLREPLAASVGVPVTLHDPVGDGEPEGQRFAAAAGLALPPAHGAPASLQLLPSGMVAVRRRRRAVQLAVPILAVALAGGVAGFAALAPDTAAARAEVAVVDAEVAAVRARLAPLQTTLDLLTATTQLRATRDGLLAGAVDATAVLAAVRAATPPEVTVTALTLTVADPLGAVVAPSTVPDATTGLAPGSAAGATPAAPTVDAAPPPSAAPVTPVDPATGAPPQAGTPPAAGAPGTAVTAGTPATVTITVIGPPAAVQAMVASLAAGDVVVGSTLSGDPAAGPAEVRGQVGPGAVGTRVGPSKEAG